MPLVKYLTSILRDNASGEILPSQKKTLKISSGTDIL